MASSSKFQAFVLFGLAAWALSGCGGAGDATQSSSPATATNSTSAGPKAPVVVSNPFAITGTPGTSIKVGQTYTFLPQTATKGSAQFSVQNKPAWTSFDTSTGKLSGTPAAKDVGTYKHITISASMNGESATLAAFDVTVQLAAQSAGQGSPANLTWVAPTGTDQVEGYRVYYGTSANSLTNVLEVSASQTSTVISNLAPGTWYFAMTSVDSSEVESALTAVVQAQI